MAETPTELSLLTEIRDLLVEIRDQRKPPPILPAAVPVISGPPRVKPGPGPT